MHLVGLIYYYITLCGQHQSIDHHSTWERQRPAGSHSRSERCGEDKNIHPSTNRPSIRGSSNPHQNTARFVLWRKSINYNCLKSKCLGKRRDLRRMKLSRGSSVRIVTSLQAGRPIRVRQTQETKPALGPKKKHLFKWVQGALTPALKRPDLKADDSPIRVSTAEVRNERSYTSPPYVFITYSGTTCKNRKNEVWRMKHKNELCEMCTSHGVIREVQWCLTHWGRGF